MIEAALLSGLTSATRLVMLDAITSNSAIALPLPRLIQACRARCALLLPTCPSRTTNTVATTAAPISSSGAPACSSHPARCQQTVHTEIPKTPAALGSPA